MKKWERVEKQGLEANNKLVFVEISLVNKH